MPLPPQIDARIRKRFEGLLAETERLIQDMTRQENAERAHARSNGVLIAGSIHVLEEEFYSLQTQVLSLLNFISDSNSHLNQIATDIHRLKNTDDNAKMLRGYLVGLKNDYESGILESISEMIEANIAADYLGQAVQLLEEGESGRFDHIPAAVLAGAVLEDALRRLCQRQTPPIETKRPNGSPKTLDPLITDLQRANMFNAAKGDMLKSWAKTRNHAAHGEFNEFTRQDVEQMLTGIRNFLADYL